MISVLVAPNSFKDCADSVTAARYIAESLKQEFISRGINDFQVIEKPLSDGGDGFLEVLSRQSTMMRLDCSIRLPFGSDTFSCMACYSPEKRTVFIESALVLGLKIIPPDYRHPLLLSSRGMGDLLKQLNNDKKSGRLKFDKLVTGIGGTGINDLGIGMASVFGLTLYDEKGSEVIPLPLNFGRVRDIEWNRPELDFEIEVITDVINPLLGPKGASRVFAPQKGAVPDEVDILEDGFTNIVNILKKKDHALKPESLPGAGGGLAAGIHYFLGGKWRTSGDFITRELGIDSNLIKPDLVLTGEGSFDSQTFLKKGAMLVIDEFSGKDIPVFVIAGSVRLTGEILSPGVKFFPLMSYFQSEEESIRNFRKGIDWAIRDIIKAATF